MRKIIAFLLGKKWKVVYLQNFEGDVRKRLANYTPFGWQAYYFSRSGDIGGVVCLEDGTTTGAIYVERWKDA